MECGDALRARNTHWEAWRLPSSKLPPRQQLRDEIGLSAA
jgi:hypothetical protein